MNAAKCADGTRCRLNAADPTRPAAAITRHPSHRPNGERHRRRDLTRSDHDEYDFG